MQHFINRVAWDRGFAEVFSGPRARHYVMAVLGLGTAAAGGLALGLIWIGLALLVDEARKALLARTSVADAADAKLALDVASATSLAAAPAIAWYARGDLGAALAIGMLCLLLSNAAFNARHGRLHAALACAPYGILTFMFALEAGAVDAVGVVLACLLCVAFVAGAAMHHAHRVSDARAQDAEWLRQCNMSEADAAAWEIDFVRQRILGGARLSAMLGRDLSYEDIVERGCSATASDLALARAAFCPARGAARRIAIDHQAVRADGAIIRLQHQGYVRTDPDGAPTRLTCVTRSNSAALFAGQGVYADAAFAAQHETLKTLANELSIPFEETNLQPPAEPEAALAAIIGRSASIMSGVMELARARNVADAANIAKSQFMAGMSHELRTPLNAIIGYAEMLLEDAQGRGDTESAHDLSRILNSAKHLLSLLNEVLDLSKIEAGRMDAAPAPFSVQDVLHDAIDTMQPLAKQNGNIISFAAKFAELVADTDATKVNQCVMNLLSNACKFTQDGEIEVSLDLRDHNGVDHFFVTVADTGIGMSREHMSRLFQPFVQADPTITQRYGGTGLGLTITRRLAQLLGGDVSVVSELGKGATFTLYIPVNFCDAATALGAAAPIDEVQGATEAPLVIVIEDEADARELAARALTRAGFAVQGVGGGEAGLALARAKSPALILLDIFLPDRSGWRVLQSLKSDAATCDIPVVVLSVNEDRAYALALGAAEHIVKPADRDVLAATVMRFARSRPSLPAVIGAPARKQTNKLG